MSGFNADTLLELRATLNEIERPWAVFVGLVTLQRLTYVERGAFYIVDASRSGFSELGQGVVVHPDDVEQMQAVGRAWTRPPRTMSDDELAAFVYWLLRTSSRFSTGASA